MMLLKKEWKLVMMPVPLLFLLISINEFCIDKFIPHARGFCNPPAKAP